MPELRLTVLIGTYAQKHYLGAAAKKNLTETVRAYRDYGPGRIPWSTRHRSTSGGRRRTRGSRPR
jgi:uracil-DNA glycosylase